MQTGSESVTGSATSAPTPTLDTPTNKARGNSTGSAQVIKRNGTVVAFEDSKISVAITKAFLGRGRHGGSQQPNS